MLRKTAPACSQLLESASLPILERARKLARLEHAVLTLLPAEFRPHCKVLNLKQEILIFSVSSPAWAARLRFAAPELVRQLQQQHALKVRGADVKITPDILEKQEVGRPRQQLSMNNALLLAQTARSVDHAELQEALYRIAAHAREI